MFVLETKINFLQQKLALIDTLAIFNINIKLALLDGLINLMK
jgi:hypothetical protein